MSTAWNKEVAVLYRIEVTWCSYYFQTRDVDFWIIPIIQGFVQIEELVVNYNESSDDEKSSPETPPQESTCVDDIHPRFLVALISRRSRHRAGRWRAVIVCKSDPGENGALQMN